MIIFENSDERKIPYSDSNFISVQEKKLNIVRFLHQVPSGLNYTETKPEISLPDFLENELKTHFPELPLFLLSHGFYKAAQVTIVF